VVGPDVAVDERERSVLVGEGVDLGSAVAAAPARWTTSLGGTPMPRSCHPSTMARIEAPSALVSSTKGPSTSVPTPASAGSAGCRAKRQELRLARDRGPRRRLVADPWREAFADERAPGLQHERHGEHAPGADRREELGPGGAAKGMTALGPRIPQRRRDRFWWTPPGEGATTCPGRWPG